MTTLSDLLTLESVRPGLMAKGSFKNSKSKGKTISGLFVWKLDKKLKAIKTQNSRQNRKLKLKP